VCSYSDWFFLDEDGEFAQGCGEKGNLPTSVLMHLAFEPERGNQVIPNARDFFLPWYMCSAVTKSLLL
jgi:hypothetical protein